MEKTGRNKSSLWKVAAIILAILLVLSGGGLVARYIYLGYYAPRETTVTVPDNLIGEREGLRAEGGVELISVPQAGAGAAEEGAVMETAEEPQATVLELYDGQEDVNEAFAATGMLPGDTVTEYYCIRAYHEGDIELQFRTLVTEESKSLGNVLGIRVTHLDTGAVLCEGPFAEVAGTSYKEVLPGNEAGETTAYYQIDAWLDTSVGNEYQAARLMADFEWYVEEEEEPIISESTSESVSESTSESVSESTSESTSESISESTSEPISEPISEWVSEPVSELESEPITSEESATSQGGGSGGTDTEEPGTGGLTPPPKTGEESEAVLWAVFLASGVLLVVLLVSKRRKGAGRHA